MTNAEARFNKIHIRKVYACLAVTCHLHFSQNDRDFLRATVVTRDRFHAPSNTVYEFGGFVVVVVFFVLFSTRSRVFLTASQTTPKSKNWPSKQNVPSKSTHTSNSWVNYNLVVMKECQWRQLKQENARVQSFFRNAPSLHPGPLTTSDILELVQTGELFGILRLDI